MKSIHSKSDHPIFLDSDRGILFVHISKCGGCSVVRNEKLFINDRAARLNLKKTWGGHPTIRDYSDCLDVSKYVKVTIIRDPVERFISAFFELSTNPGNKSNWEKFQKNIKTADINEYLAGVDEEKAEHGLPGCPEIRFNKHLDFSLHFYPQVRFLINYDNMIDMDYICNTENMSQTIPDIFGIKKEEFIRKNVNKSKPKVDISDENIAKLKRIYEMDYKIFGFDQGKDPKGQALYAKNQTRSMLQKKEDGMGRY